MAETPPAARPIVATVVGDNLSWTVNEDEKVKKEKDSWARGVVIGSFTFGDGEGNQGTRVQFKVGEWIPVKYKDNGIDKAEFAQILEIRKCGPASDGKNVSRICVSWGYPLATVPYAKREEFTDVIDDLGLQGSDIVASNNLQVISAEDVDNKSFDMKKSDRGDLVLATDCEDEDEKVSLCGSVWINKGSDGGLDLMHGIIVKRDSTAPTQKSQTASTRSTGQKRNSSDKTRATSSNTERHSAAKTNVGKTTNSNAKVDQTTVTKKSAPTGQKKGIARASKKDKTAASGSTRGGDTHVDDFAANKTDSDADNGLSLNKPGKKANPSSSFAPIKNPVARTRKGMSPELGDDNEGEDKDEDEAGEEMQEEYESPAKPTSKAQSKSKVTAKSKGSNKAGKGGRRS